MNAERRKKIDEIAGKLEALREELADVQSQEQEAFDNMPEGLQASEKGQAVEEAADNLQTACDDLENVVSSLNEISGG